MKITDRLFYGSV